MQRITDAYYLARELGYRDTTPTFWAQVKKYGLKRLPGLTFSFDYDEALERMVRK